MDIWEREIVIGGKVTKTISAKKLISRLKLLEEQTDIEVLKLAIKSMIDELEEK